MTHTTDSPRELDSQQVHCIHAETCGGCPMIDRSYAEQLEAKQSRVVHAVARYLYLHEAAVLPVIAAEPIVGYRSRAKLIVASGGRIGLFAKGGGHVVLDIPECRVLAPVLANVAAILRELVREDEINGGPLAPFEPEAGRGELRAVDLREIRVDDAKPPRVLVTFVVQRSASHDEAKLRRAAERLMQLAPDVIGVAANLHEGDLPQILGNETVVLAGVPNALDRVGSSLHLATYGSFVQTHRGQAGRVHALVAEALGLRSYNRSDAASLDVPRMDGALRVLDLYGGSGAIALGLARLGAEVHTIESFAPAVAGVLTAARDQQLQVTAECGDVSTLLGELADRGDVFDAAIVNPPRRGVSPEARERLVRLAPPTIVYVSCDPDTLARDLDHFSRLGYEATTLAPLDMIPLTDEVETVAVLRRAALPLPRVLFEDDAIIVVEKGPHEPSTPQDGYAQSLMSRTRRLANAEDAIPVHRIDIGTSGLVLFVKNPDQYETWVNVMTSPTTRRIYIAATRGVTPTKGAIVRDLRDDGKLYSARTRYRRLAIASGHSVLRVVPEQGRTHQVRRHLAAIGHPVLGDARYGHPPTNRFFEEKNGLDRPFLHFVRVEFEHPGTGMRHIVEAPMPGDLRAVLERSAGAMTLKFLDHKHALGTGAPSSMPPTSNDERGVDAQAD